MLLQKLDEKTQTKWEETASSDRIPTAGEFYDFLEKRCQKMENVQYAIATHAGSAQHDADHLGESYTQAYRRFLSLERKLDRNPALKERYSAFMKEYTDLKHMSKVHLDSRSLCKYFLPHHCVLKEDSTTTKLRVVFDGSAATSTGCSLNDVMITGPVIQPTLFNILIRFRTHPVALTGDICKMYRCVKVSPPDNFLQCILWRDSIQSEVLVYTLDTVTYGTRAASFLAVRAMNQLAIDEGNPYPLGSAALQQ
ncbi:uncharacterized protein LOC121404067 [Drosophila obscura]|uniref:uncharacterized protein LOC121404067 n=1 Tax=Drosophila obscura TaxID=7282 RepID=UPI001BB0D7F2|nr:uncharacterized protein LOC121404067 [Drosophila obscura]